MNLQYCEWMCLCYNYYYSVAKVDFMNASLFGYSRERVCAMNDDH